MEKRSKVRKPFKRTIRIERIIPETDRMIHIYQKEACLDISEDGLGVIGSFPLEKGQIVKLFIPISKGDTTLPVFAEIMWVKTVNDEIRAGLSFLK